jgi:hypothetical protein
MPLLSFAFLLLSCNGKIAIFRENLRKIAEHRLCKLIMLFMLIIIVHWQRIVSNHKPILHIINGLCCFTLVIVYLYTSAIPAYNKPKWATEVEFNTRDVVPAVALFEFSSKYRPRAFNNTWGNCLYSPDYNYNGTDQCPDLVFSGNPISLSITTDLVIEAYIFDPTALRRESNSVLMIGLIRTCAYPLTLWR